MFILWLPPNATHLLQFLGVAIFSSLKKSWRWFAILYTRRLEVGSANESVVWQEILSFLTETFNEYSGRNYEKNAMWVYSMWDVPTRSQQAII